MLRTDQTAVGVAHSEYVPEVLRLQPGLLDFVEIPFEQLIQTPAAAEIGEELPIILHCASLSIAGDAPLDPHLVDKLAHWVAETRTPWIGEHLAYVRADGRYREMAEHLAVGGSATPECASIVVDGAPFNVGYTVSPQLSAPILERVLDALAYWEGRLGTSILLENGPVYFAMPGSTMTQVQFLNALCTRRRRAQLLLDLSHLAITCSNLRLDPIETLDALPLDRVVEVHISGAREEDGIVWDDHTLPGPPLVFDLLERLLQRSRPRAVTLEYNWDATFPVDVVIGDIARVRRILDVVRPSGASA